MKRRIMAKGLAIAFFMTGAALLTPREVWALTLPDGLYVGEYSLGGMTEEEADEKVRQIVDEMAAQKITLVIEGNHVETTAKELGFTWSNPDAVSEAAAAYQGGNLIRRYLNQKDIEHNPVKIPIETNLDADLVAAFVQEKCEPFTTPPQEATITRQDGKFIVTPSAAGITVDVEATKKALNEAILRSLSGPVTVEASVAETEPVRSTEALSTIQDVLGTFSTDFGSSGTSRATNLRVGSGKINGHVLMQGETLSGYECMQPFTTANGYATAAAYENGQVVDSVGGGVCQIATTLYNAALRAEVEITQRQNHSMVVSYVKPSEDAAIAGTYKDIKITNNYSTPIYVEGYTSGHTLTFTIYGKETRPANRTFKFVSETLSVTDPGAPKEEIDPSLPPGARRQVQSAHRGLKSRLWKYVYVDGVEQSREILHTDSYAPSKAIVKVGPAAPAVVTPIPEETAAQPETPTDNQQSEPESMAPVEGIHGGPGVTRPAPENPTAQDSGPAETPQAQPSDSGDSGAADLPSETSDASAPGPGA